ncbi:tetratricopeptide repeat protein [Phormidium sp. FACHB-592]|uniref:Tetratricopeptide repeat protein n=1 Tax=Stenomitos frigidus AS-A4 TaxID=2933935 RepID=A0ABV0KLW5_9CYAN|nr:tetratricopeptide repeat protein [Phormidium sp. FACHB-592]MBD2072574.1 tetratricopeptide repeat protein [Phormidium sp. FACHB-592]
MLPNHRPRTWKELRNRPSANSFVGREAQLQSFRSTLNTPYEQRTKFIFNVSGQGGIGKTTLLKQFRKIVEDSKQVVAYVDEGAQSNQVDSVPEALDRLAADFEAQGHAFTRFRERYKVYRQKRQELEADPDAPQGFVAGLGRVVAKASLGAAKSIPGSGAVLDFVDTNAMADKTGEIAAFVARKITNKDEVQLVNEPLEVLTPLFLVDFNRLAEKQTMVLLLDTYEQTTVFWDDWVRSLLDDRYGDVTPNFLLAIAGRDPLNRNDWTALEECILRSELEPFTQEEARQYLTSKGITHEAVIQEIWRLSSNGLPLLIGMMAQAAPTSLNALTDHCEDAVERFLKWETDPVKRQTAMDAALPRVLNRDVLALLVAEADVKALFEWLKSRSFVIEHPEGWQYHSVVREPMLRYQRKVSRQGWETLHGKLATYYDQLRQQLGLKTVADVMKDETWQKYTLEWLYHSLCIAPQAQLGMALNGCLAALKHSQKLARGWASVMAIAGEVTTYTALKDWGEQLRDGLQAYKDKDYKAALDLFSALLQAPQLDARWRPVALDWRGSIYWRLDEYESSLQDLTEAINLAPEEAKYWLDRGKTYHWMKCYEEALTDFNRAIALDASNQWAIANRGATYRKMKRYEEALTDFNCAIALDASNQWVIANRGGTYRLMKRYEEALTDFNHAIALDASYKGAITLRGETYRLMKRYEEALTDFNHAIALDASYKGVMTLRGMTYRLMKRYEEALTDFNHAIALDAKDAWAIANRGGTCRLMKRYEEALIDFNYAIALDAKDAWTIARRGQTYRALKQYDKAILDFNRAIELDPNSDWTLRGRGTAYLLKGQFENALQDLTQAITLDPKDDWTPYLHALAHLKLNQFQLAQTDLATAIQLAQPKYDQTPTDWQNTFNLALYHLVADHLNTADDFYRQSLIAPSEWLRMGIDDLQEFLTLFPDHAQAQQMVTLLRSKLETNGV